MAKQNDTGVYQLPNGNWAYRFTFTVEGKKKNRKGTKDQRTGGTAQASPRDAQDLPRGLQGIL